MIQITNEDLKLTTQKIITLKIQIDIYDEVTNQLLDSVKGSISGSSGISAESDIRRTFSVNVIPDKRLHTTVSENGLIWVNRIAKIKIGIYNNRTKQYKWYRQGTYAFTNTSATYDTTNNQLTLNCSDLITKLDGTKNGQSGALTILLPAYKEDEETGEVIEYYSIRDTLISVLKKSTQITDYEIDDMGEHMAMPQYNEAYEEYRRLHPTWNAVPFDLTFSCGCSIWSVLTTLRDIYPNYEMYFDENGTFICQLIPSCYEEDIVFDNSYLKKILISENTSIDLSSVRNICEVWGQILNPDFSTEDCTLSGNCYVCNVDQYEEQYYNGDLIAVKIPKTNPASFTININGFGEIEVCAEAANDIIEEGSLKPNTFYVFKIRKTREDKQDIIKAYLLGQWQAHGLNVLVDGSISKESYTTSDGKTVKRYSKEYFQDRYQCSSVAFTVIPDSPFTVQKIGEILDVKTGGEYENITSDSLALAKAEWENRKNCRLTDSINITTKICPFANVNMKVSYQRSDLQTVNQYIVKSVSHDFSGGTTTWNLMRFYPYFADTLKKTGTHKVLAGDSHGILSKYTHEQLTQFTEGKEA